MQVWTDGGWNPHRSIGYASVFIEGGQRVVIPVFRTTCDSSGCEARALMLAVALTPDDSNVRILCDSLSLVEQIHGKASCAVLELIPYVRWIKRNVGARTIEWCPRDGNPAHIPLSEIFDRDDHWHNYELLVLRERKKSE